MAKKNKDIQVWFSDSAADTDLRTRIKNRCVHMSESAFMKEAAEEKLRREQYMEQLLITGHQIPQIVQSVQQNTQDTTMTESDLENFLDGIE